MCSEWHMRVALHHGATSGHHQNAPKSRVAFAETRLGVDEARMVLVWHRPCPMSSPEGPSPSPPRGAINGASESGLDRKAQDVTRDGIPVWIQAIARIKRISRRKGVGM